MPLEKQGINIPFGQGLDLKTDPNQVAMGKMLGIQNVRFDNGGQLQKRNGFGLLSTLSTTDNTTLTTLNDNLIATGQYLYAYSADSDQWLNRGTVQPVDLDVQPLVRNSKSQTNIDSAIASNGLVCSVFHNGSLPAYQINDVNTGQIIQPLTDLPASSSQPRVFVLGQYFIITYLRTITGTPTLLYYSIPHTNPTATPSATTISSQVKAVPTGYDAVVANNNLYIAWYGSDVGGAIRFCYLTSTLGLSSVSSIASEKGDLVSVAADTSGATANIYISFWDTATGDLKCAVRSYTLASVTSATTIVNATLNRITSIAYSGSVYIYYEVSQNYSYTAVASDYISTKSMTQAGSVSSATVVLRSVGLASKPIRYQDINYFLVAYGGAQQPTYFLINSSGQVILKLAYQNGGGYNASQILSSISEYNSLLYVPYLYKDFLVPVNKTQGVATVNGIYTQTGVNIAAISINNTSQLSSEIAKCRHLTGGIMWQYDAVLPVELGFHLYPEDITATMSNGAGTLTAQQYYYAVTYEWTDSRGLLHRSAPSSPIGANLVAPDDTITLNIPTLRVTYKNTANPVRIVIYRWSTAQPVYYQVTSVASPTLNDTTADNVTYVDTTPDSGILGNAILYTTGAVVENIAPPASSGVALYRSRLWLIDAEDKNLLWFSKQVIEGTPVEMSDLLTYYVAPTSGAQGSTGPITAISAMDDKLIIFKKDAIYYVTGNGPDNTGANNDFSEPVFITSTVGCDNPDSIVMQPNGLMFQSDKGIWMLGRNLSTVYVGADVQSYKANSVTSAVTIPNSTQVRFTLDNNLALLYDYYYQQWATFSNVSALSSTIYNGLHTFLTAEGEVRQETPGVYLDGTIPVLMSFTTAWLKLTNIQGFQRAYFFYLLGTYLTPHKLSVRMAYDYNPTILQSAIIEPTNYSPAYGGDPLYGSGSPYGGPSSVEQWRVFLSKQKCQSVQITVNEVYDSSKGVPAGAGLTLSGINMVIGAKAGYPKLTASESTG